MTELADGGGPDALFLEVQGALKGRYSLVAELGRGGMGVVYLAREVKLDRLVALKLLPPALAAHAVARERFLREARVAARLTHPNIVPIYAADESGPFAWFAMAYVRGETLTARVARGGALPAAEVARIVREVAWALAYAHAQGIVHRDVKPDNILLEEGTGRVLVADFGIARSAESAVSDPGRLAGTPAFMSPEQAAGDRVDGRSDLYSLGLVAHFALTGELPFHEARQSPAKTLARRLEGDCPSLAHRVPHAPAALVAAVDRCAALDPAERFPDAAALAAALDRTVHRMDPLPEPLARWLGAGRDLRLRHVLLTPLLTAPVMTIIDLVLNGFSSAWASSAYMFTAVVGPPVLFGLSRLLETRRLAEAGYRQRDLGVALEREATEQLAIGAELRRSRLRRAADTAVGTALVGIGAISAIAIGSSDPLVTAAVAVYSAAGAAVVAARMRGTAHDPVESFALRMRRKFWEGKLGKAVLWLARRGHRDTGAGTADLHRPTELALGAAALGIWEALPTVERKRLPEVPALVDRLERRARALRAKADGPDAEAASRALAETVSALETLRLDLLRLRAGIVTLEGVTDDLAAVRRVGADVDAALDAKAEADALLREPTPA
jgi:serine/threonine-protein kinase